MYKFLSKNGQTIAFVVGTVLTVLFLGIAVSGLENFNMQSKETQYGTNIFNLGFYAAIGLTIACAAAWLLFGLFQTATNFKKALIGIVGIAVLLGLFFIIYSSVNPAADSAPVLAEVEKFDVTESQSKFISGGIITTVVLLGLAFVTFIVFEVINFFR